MLPAGSVCVCVCVVRAHLGSSVLHRAVVFSWTLLQHLQEVLVVGTFYVQMAPDGTAGWSEGDGGDVPSHCQGAPVLPLLGEVLQVLLHPVEQRVELLNVPHVQHLSLENPGQDAVPG